MPTSPVNTRYRETHAALFAAWVVAILVALFPGDARAQDRSISIENFHVDITVNTDASIVVSEKIRFYFDGSWNGVIRSIPVKYRTPQGFNYTLKLKGVTVTDDRGNELEFEASRARHYQEYKIWVPGARNASREIQLTYRVDNALTFFDEHDELYWNVTGDEWEMTIAQASARIHLPEGVSGVRATSFSGAAGSRVSDATVDVPGGVVDVRMNRPLQYHEGLTAVVGWNKGVVERPTAFDKAMDFLSANWPIGVPFFIVLPFMYWLWHTRGRDPKLRPVMVRYDPPEGLSPGEVGTLADNSPDMRDVTATLVHLATRGYIAIEEKNESEFFGMLKSKDFSFQSLKPVTEWSSLAPHEWSLMNGIFETGEHTFVPLDSLKNRFYTQIPKINDRLFDGLMKRGYYASRPDRVKAGYVISGFIIGALVFGISVTAGESIGIAPLAGAISGILSGLIIIGFGLVMPARTKKGAEALEGVLGFEEFLRRVEGPRFSRADLKPELFEKYLPYAMALGVESSWAKAFEGIANMSPSWYRGTPGGIFHPAAFTHRLGAMSTQAASVMSSAPRAKSGGSGFGGGGMSGGGFGGGGGRGF